MNAKGDVAFWKDAYVGNALQEARQQGFQIDVDPNASVEMATNVRKVDGR